MGVCKVLGFRGVSIGYMGVCKVYGGFLRLGLRVQGLRCFHLISSYSRLGSSRKRSFKCLG